MIDPKITQILKEQSHVHSLLVGSESIQIEIQKMTTMILECYKKGNKILFCGNGGSAADAQHLAAEFSGRFILNRPALPALALHSNSSELTAVANDFGYGSVFERAIEAHGKGGDICIGISTSGKSPNILKALKKSQNLGIKTIAWCGQNSHDMIFCDLVLSIPSNSTARVQECHIKIGHIICEIVEEKLFGNFP